MNKSIPKNVQDQSLTFGQLLFLLQRLDRHPTTYGAAGQFTPSEIHTIDAIGCDQAILMSELAAKLKVTKGAVTQLANKLEKKGAIQRTPHPTDKRAVLLSLTDIGVLAYKEQQAVRSYFYTQLANQMNSQELTVFQKGIEITIELLQRLLAEDKS